MEKETLHGGETESHDRLNGPGAHEASVTWVYRRGDDAALAVVPDTCGVPSRTGPDPSQPRRPPCHRPAVDARE